MRKLVVALLAASPAKAEVVTTDEIRSAIDELVEEMTCKDVMATIAINDNAITPTTSEYLQMLVIRNFIYGYAFANGQSFRQAIEDTIIRCTKDFESPFAEIPDY